MRTSILALLLTAGLSAQQPVLRGTFGSVVHPAGNASTGVTRTLPSVVNPGGGGVHLYVPGAAANPVGSGPKRSQPSRYVGYPVYIGGYGYGYDSSYISQQPPIGYEQPQQQASQPNVTVVYPQQAPVTPVIINMPGYAPTRAETQPAQAAAEEVAPPIDQPFYLIAFQDHVIYAATNYWVDGDTIHYFTEGNKHNTASISQIDRPLTERLNRNAGLEVKLPPAR